MARIEAWARPVRGSAGQYYHVYLAYVDDDGNRTTISAVPAGFIFGGPFGVKVSPYESGGYDYPKLGEQHVLLAVEYSGADALDKWNTIQSKFNSIVGDNKYFIPYQNSNSAANSALDSAGLPTLNRSDLENQFHIRLPGLDNLHLNFVPDADGHLVAHAEDGMLTFVVDQNGTPIASEIIGLNGNHHIGEYVNGTLVSVTPASSARTSNAARNAMDTIRPHNAYGRCG